LQLESGRVRNDLESVVLDRLEVSNQSSVLGPATVDGDGDAGQISGTVGAQHQDREREFFGAGD
jgi:hypothetical protein